MLNWTRGPLVTVQVLSLTDRDMLNRLQGMQMQLEKHSHTIDLSSKICLAMSYTAQCILDINKLSIALPGSGTNHFLEQLKSNERENFRVLAEKVRHSLVDYRTMCVDVKWVKCVKNHFVC